MWKRTRENSIQRIEFHSFFHHCHHQHNHCVFIHSSRYDSANFFSFFFHFFFVLCYHYLSQNLSFLFFSFEFCFYLLIFHIFCCLWSWWRQSKIFNFLFTFSHTIYSCVFDHVIGTPTKKIIKIQIFLWFRLFRCQIPLSKQTWIESCLIFCTDILITRLSDVFCVDSGTRLITDYHHWRKKIYNWMFFWYFICHTHFIQ